MAPAKRFTASPNYLKSEPYLPSPILPAVHFQYHKLWCKTCKYEDSPSSIPVHLREGTKLTSSARLRDMVWKEALSVPKIISIKLTMVSSSANRQVNVRHASTMSDHSVLLRVNKESRAEAKKVYFPCRISPHSQTTVYMKHSIDMLWFRHFNESLPYEYFKALADDISRSHNPITIKYPRIVLSWPFEVGRRANLMSKVLDLYQRFMTAVTLFSIREVLLVVGDTTDGVNPINIAFM